jgi:Flp pilus assembly protein TadD
MNKNTTLLSIAIIALLGFAVYTNSLNGEFVWDDHTLVKGNVYIRNWSHLGEIFSGSVSSMLPKSGIYRPAQIITYLIDYQVWKLNVLGYHLTNILVHVCVALSLFWLINLLFKDIVISLLTGLFFVIHPIHTEAVTYISGRADSLALLFMLLCFIFYVKSLYSKNNIFYVLIPLSYAVALLSRENSLILPVLLVLYHYSFKEKFKFGRFSTVLGAGIIYMLLRKIYLTSSFTSYPTTFFQRLPGFFVAITNYLKLLFLPFGLHMEYGSKLFRFTDPQAILGILICIALVTYILKQRGKNTLVFFSLSWFFITLMPVSNLYPLNAYMAEHWLYLPSIGFFLIMAGVLRRGFAYEKFGRLVVAGAIILLGFYGILTIKQNHYWKDSITLYERILRFVPDDAEVYNNLGLAYSDAGRKERVIPLYKKAIELDPNYAEAYNNLGVAYNNMGKHTEAIEVYQKAITLNPDYAQAYNNLGKAYSDTNRNEEAISSYKKAIELNPTYAVSYNNLASVYNKIGRYQEAVGLYKKAIDIDPDYVDAYNNIAGAYNNLGKRSEAIAAYKQAIKINPNWAMAYRNLAVIYIYDQQYDLAIQYYDKAIELGASPEPQVLELLKPYRK